LGRRRPPRSHGSHRLLTEAEAAYLFRAANDGAIDRRRILFENDHLREALAVSGHDLILLLGGLFLLWKSAHEIHESMEANPANRAIRVPSRYWMVLAQIAVIDIVFSLDSVITAIGMASHVPVMVIAIGVGVMMLTAKSIGEFVAAHPSIKLLALSFLILVGIALIAEGLGQQLPKGYIHFAMAFSVTVETLNIRTC
jgi:predicted tellurium resistance membrane protein TerC